MSQHTIMSKVGIIPYGQLSRFLILLNRHLCVIQMNNIVIFCIAALLLLGCENSQDKVGIKISKMEQDVIESIMGNPQPVCVGRYIFDLPEQFFADGASVYINKNAIEAQPMPLPAFEQRIRLREQKLEKTDPLQMIDAPYLKNIHSIPDQMNGVIFERNLNNYSPDMARVLEAHYYQNSVAFKTEIKVINTDAVRYIEERKDFPSNVTNKISELNKLLRKLKGVRENEPIPKGKGLCFNHGFIAGDSLSIVGSDWGEEDAGIAFTLKQYPKLNFRIKSNNYLKAERTLLERAEKGALSKLLRSFGSSVKNLAKGRREIHDAIAEELLIFNASDENNIQYNFLMYINEKSGSNSTPFLSAELRYELSGNYLADDDLTEKQLLSIWYQLTNSIRIRPGAI